MSRRITTARQQVEMLSPWREAAEDSRWLRERGTWRYPEATQKLIDSVRALTGIRLDMEDTGGRSYVLSGRLEDGSWLTAGDADDGLNWWDARDREKEEGSDGPKGWHIAIHHHRDDEHGGGWLGEEPYHVHVDEKAHNHELPRVVAEALATLPHGDKKQHGAPDPAPRVDYDNLVNPRPELDDDYGDIFGKESMRRTAALFDWEQKYHEPDLAWHTKTETGHVLTVNSPRALSGAGRTLDANKRGEDIGWAWHIHDLNDPDPLIQDYPWYGHASLTAHLKGGLIHAPEHGTDPAVYSGEYLPTFDAAVAQAEKAFLERFSGGRRHPRADIPDYEGLINPRLNPDDDYGDFSGLFGKEGAKRRPTTQDILDDVRAKHGINLEMANTGGGCYVLEGRLEDGSWIRAADHQDFCYPELADRHFAEERDGEPLGWDVSFHSNVHDEGGPMTFPGGKTVDFPPTDYWASSNEGAEPIHWHSDPDARVEDLSRVIGDAFRTMPHDAKRVQQDALRESLAADGWGPGDEEWEKHFPGEGGGKAIDVPTDLPPAGRKPHSLGDEDYGDIFGKEGALRTAAGWSESYQPWADWRRITGKDGNTAYNEWHGDASGSPQDTYHHWMAPLENGHELHAWSYQHDDRNRDYGWTWAIRDPHGDETGWDEDNRMWLSGGGPDTPVYDEDEDEDAIYPDLGSAVKKAEEKYRALFPVGGAGTGGHRSEIDNGVDYDRLVNPRHDLDEGYGDIFGGG